MRLITRWGKAACLSALLAWGLAGCGGGSGSGDPSPRVSYSSLITFGDSLSDVGTYKVGTVAALGGGRYTVNSSTDKNWTELLAAQLGLAAPCAAQTGLDGSAANGFSVPVVNHADCFNYAQGGARVTNPVGPGSKYLADSAALGQLTVPVVTQISNHLAKVNGKFLGTELVTVMAGGNDVFMNLGAVSANLMTPDQAVAAMAAAATELAGYIQTQILAKGAKKVLVVSIPDIKNTPFGLSQSAAGQQLVDSLVTAYNTQLATSLQGVSGVVKVDAYTASRDQVVNPGQYGLTNVTSTACNLAPVVNVLKSSLVCNANNLNAGDVSHYLFADTVHPTPYGYKLLAQQVIKDLVLAQWL